MSVESILGPFSVEEVSRNKVVRAFDSQVLDLLNLISRRILTSPEAKSYPDLASFAFFIRKANLEILARKKIDNNSFIYLGVGLAFHIAPSNVPLNFAYSLVASLLCGNPSVVRVSSKHFAQTEVLIKHFLEAADEMKIDPLFTFVRYDRDSSMNEKLSKLARVRMIWGGNETINFFKSMAVQPNVIDVTFPNKYSLTVVGAEQYLTLDKIKVARDFYNEVYTFDQNACTSPKAVVWLGEPDVCKSASRVFWEELVTVCKDKGYAPSISSAVMQFSEVALHAAQNRISKKSFSNTVPVKVFELKAPTSTIFQGHPGEGLYYECSIKEIRSLKDFITEECQTITTVGLGNHKIVEWIADEGILGVDRVCAVGKASIFSLDWDGKDLFALMTRKFAF